MHKPRIAFDIDGVLANTEPALKREIVKKFPHLDVNDIQHSGMYHNMYQFDDKGLEEDVRQLIDFYFRLDPQGIVYRDAEPYRPSLGAIPLLDQFEPVAYITRRPELFRQVTQEWLDKYEYPKLPLYMIERGTCKSDKMKELDIDIIVEDSPSEIESCLMSNVNVIIIPHNYNEKLRMKLELLTDVPDNMFNYKVKTWYDLVHEGSFAAMRESFGYA